MTNDLNNNNLPEKKQVLDDILLYCAKILLTDYDIDKALNTLLQDLCKFHNAERAYIFSINFDEETVDNTYEYCVEGVVPYIDNLQGFPTSILKVWFDFYEKDVCIFERVVKDLNKPEEKEEQDFLKSQNIDSILVISLHKNNKLIGFLGLNNPKNNLDNIHLLQAISGFVVNNIIKFELTNQLENKIAEFKEVSELDKAMLECATILLEDTDSQIIINKLLKNITSYYNAECTYMVEFDHLLSEVKNIYSFNVPSDTIKSLTNMLLTINANTNTKKHTANWVKLFKTHNVIDDTLIKKAYLNNNNINYQILKKQNLDNLLIKPLIQKNNIIGFIGIEKIKKNKHKYELLTTVSAFTINHIQSRDMLDTLQELSSKDILTGAFNRNHYLSTINRINDFPPKELGVVFADVNSLKVINDYLGHEYGDILIKTAFKFLKEAFKKIDNSYIFRIGGDEFVCILEDISQDNFNQAISHLEHLLDKTTAINISIGVVWEENNNSDHHHINVEKQILEADTKMYENKKEFYKKNPKSKLDLAEIHKKLDKIAEYL